MKNLQILVSRWASKKYFPECLLAAICLLTYANSLNNSFLIDDYDLILNNFKVHHPKYFLFEFFPGLNPYQPSQPINYYRPVMNVFPMLLFVIFKWNVFGYHFISLVILYLSSLCVFKLIRTFFGQKVPALLTGIFFILHPFNGIIVYYNIASVFGIQIIAMISSILLFQRSLKTPRPYLDMTLSSLAFVLALLCHDSALILPLLIMATQTTLDRPSVKRSFLFLAPNLMIAVVFFAVKTLNSSSMSSLAGPAGWGSISLTAHLAATTRLMAWYLQQLFVPNGVVFIWSTSGHMGWQLLWAFSGVLVLVACCLAIFSKTIAKELRWGLSWFLIGCFAVGAASRFEPSSGWLIEPHWIYLPSIACFFMISFAFLCLSNKFTKQVAWSLCALYLLFILACSWQLNRTWSDEKKYCQYWAENSPELAAPLSYLSSFYLREGDPVKAKEAIHQAIHRNKNSAILYYKLASLYFYENQLPSAMTYFNKALEFSPQSSIIRYNLALLNLHHKRMEPAEKYLKEALRINPMLLEARLMLAKMLFAEGNIPAVLDLVEVNLKINPNHLQTIEFIKALGNKE